MATMEYLGTKAIFAVAQQPFEASSEGSIFNKFCTLVPLFSEDGVELREDDFPNNGLVWWMLRSGVRGIAEPGRLVTGVLEKAVRYEADNPEKMIYQTNRDSVELVRPDDLLEILSILPTAITNPRDLVNRTGVVQLDHAPSTSVLVRWKDRLYGPLRASSQPFEGRRSAWSVSLETPTPDHRVQSIPSSRLTLPEVARHHRRTHASVSAESSVRDRGATLRCDYELLLGPGLDFLSASDTEIVALETDRDVLRSLAGRFFKRKDRQEMMRLYDRLLDSAGSSPDPASEAELATIRTLSAEALEDERSTHEIVGALLESPAIASRLEERIGQEINRHIEENAARLAAETMERLATLRTEMQSLEREKESRLGAIDDEARVRTQATDREIEARYSALEEMERGERQSLQTQREELDRQREIVSSNLEAVTERFTNARDDVMNQFLALMPLLRGTGLLAEPVGLLGSGRHEPPMEPKAVRAFELPTFIGSSAHESEQTELSEAAFLDRFVKHVESSGYRYRRIDLVSFHLSVKCNDLNVLAGLSGIGKSSLPRLYAEALSGSDREGVGRHLHVGVSPGWLDMRDVIGHVNAIEKRFEPAECGIFPHLIAAMEEWDRKGPLSGIYLICLDEMNLSHVEHYFSGFLHALERPMGQRSIRCFVPENVDVDSAFARWPQLELPPSVRFVGTVNMDETTRQLSIRLLDRTNLIQLGVENEIGLDVAVEGQASPEGPPISLRSFRQWTGTGQLNREAAQLIDELRQPLLVLGCQITQRRYRAILRFLGSAPPELCSQEAALDLQIAQRLLPQVRGLFRRDMRDATERFVSILESQRFAFPESLRVLTDLRRSEGDDGDFAVS